MFPLQTGFAQKVLISFSPGFSPVLAENRKSLTVSNGFPLSISFNVLIALQFDVVAIENR